MDKLVQHIKMDMPGIPKQGLYCYGEASFEANQVMQEPLERLYKYEVKEYGGEYEEYFIENENIDGNILDDITMSIEEFKEIFEKIGGKVVTNLEDYIRYKYRPA